MIRIPSLEISPELADLDVGIKFRGAIGSKCGLTVSVLTVSIGGSNVSTVGRLSLLHVISGLIPMKGTTQGSFSLLFCGIMGVSHGAWHLDWVDNIIL